MSTLWTPDGERPVRRSEPATPPPAPSRPVGGPAPGDGGNGDPPDEAELQAQMAELQEQLANTPAEVVIANHAFGQSQTGCQRIHAARRH